MTRKKPEGVEALVLEEDIPLDEIRAVDLFACFCMLSGMGSDPDIEAKQAYDRAYAMLRERKRKR
jgi:hypothetical protein